MGAVKRAVILEIAAAKRVSVAVARQIYELKSIAEKQRLCEAARLRNERTKSR